MRLNHEADLVAAATVARANFGPVVEFVVPLDTGEISLTGQACALNCAHCGRHYLRAMGDLRRAEREAAAGLKKSFLVSGGCDAQGRVPFRDHLDELRRLREPGVRLNFHAGLVDEDDARLLGGLADVVSFDFTVDEATIREVYHLPHSGSDYERSYQLLRRYARVVPHVCIGLKGGQIAGEEAAIERLAELGADAVTFIVFRPTPGTAYADRQPPAPEEVARVIARARLLMPRTPLYLGCMRPGGEHRAATDRLALRAGIQRLVQPGRGAAEEAAALGLTVRTTRECCSL